MSRLRKNGHALRQDPMVRQCAVTISFMNVSELSKSSGLSASTARRLIHGKTYRPQNYTIDRLLYAAGFERKIIKRST